MLRQVRGIGTLVPEEIRWIPAATEGRVEQILLRSSAVVQSESIILVLSNTELERTALDAQLQLKAVEAELANLRLQLESQLLNQRAAAATIAADFRQAKLQAEVDDQLYKEGLTSDLNQKRSRLRAEELATRHELEQRRRPWRRDSSWNSPPGSSPLRRAASSNHCLGLMHFSFTRGIRCE
jgi:HlyD family secretion protein